MANFRSVSAILLVLSLTATASFADPVDISGPWRVTTTGFLGITRQNIIFDQTADRLGGEMVNSVGTKEAIKSGIVTGNQVEFRVLRRRATGKTVLVLYRGKLTGNQISGSFVGWSGRTVFWIATRR